MKRWDVLNHLIEVYGYQSFLEIGVSGGAVFKRIRVRDKTGVDPRLRLWSALRFSVKKRTSDSFFTRNRRSYDLIFVDGLHVADQALLDIRGSLAVLKPGGTIVVHDCLPRSENQQVVPRAQASWTGNVWRAFLKVSQDPTLLSFVIDCETGCGVIQRRSRPGSWPSVPQDLEPMEDTLSWADFERNRNAWLKIVPAAAGLQLIDSLASGGR